ncbi:MAG: hypothetical protein ACE5RP_07055 [Nitrosopumilus sp.]
MARRITIMVDDELDKRIRAYQAKVMKRDNSSYSYSRAINGLLKKAI